MILLIFFLIVSLALIGFGIALTVYSREDPSKHNVPSWVTDNMNLAKTSGPICIGVGVLGLAVTSWSLMKGMNYTSHGGENTVGTVAKSSFGFKFY